ncbi:thioredoxin fold domain-containing protein [Geomonas sp. Red32]|uniref:thioredoxin fold domain-containing protein n=1 Tax=Geomonas sp. Red32 TaxID=2912856 RepID=UPI00202CF38D|nr:thioredoxin fold domain-containing protein [Geomonas sp. Red32]MCM0083996.1 thioredoxin fold domain-containing protein [Geomonas sp. Red32]
MIPWESEMSKALARGKAEQKCILLDFFSPECIGCQQMEEASFPNQSVANFITDRMVPIHAAAGTSTLSADFNVVWTPTLVVLDFYGREHQRTVGFLPPDEMVAWLLLGIGKTALDKGQHNEAVLQFNTLMNGYPTSAAAPEAIYLRGVSRFKTSQTAATLKETYQQLKNDFPHSEWTKRAEPFALL